MSGHSHFATIKRKKEANDAAKGQVFSRLSQAISIAVKTGGGSDPDMNSKLRVAIDKARSLNMPKANIERAISKGEGGGNLAEVTYEGFGPDGVGIIIEVATDNRNRTGQEIKNILEKSGGGMAGPGAVAFNFQPKGYLVVDKSNNAEEQMLTLIDLGVEDIEETDDGIEIYVNANQLSQTKDKLEKKGFKVTLAELIQKPKSYHLISDEGKAKKILALVDALEDHDDVQKVYANIDIAEEIVDKVTNE